MRVKAYGKLFEKLYRKYMTFEKYYVLRVDNPRYIIFHPKTNTGIINMLFLLSLHRGTLQKHKRQKGINLLHTGWRFRAQWNNVLVYCCNNTTLWPVVLLFTRRDELHNWTCGWICWGPLFNIHILQYIMCSATHSISITPLIDKMPYTELYDNCWLCWYYARLSLISIFPTLQFSVIVVLVFT